MKEKHIALNTQLLWFGVAFLGALCLSVFSAADRAIDLCIGFAILAAVIAFGCAIMPQYVTFSDECIKIVYLFGQREIIKWSDIRSVSSEGSWFAKGGGLPRYVIAYPRKEKNPFFVVGEIPRTRTTKRLMALYYKKKIQTLS